MRSIALALSVFAVSGAALASGQVDVSFKPVQELADAGNDRFDAERNLKTLSAHLQSLAPRLPDGQRLTIEVLDLNLAGEMKPLRRGGEVRVLKGSADWPTMTLRWSLAADGRTLRSAEEQLSDMNYLMQPLRAGHEGPLAYEQRMIDRWFDQRFGGTR